MGNLMSERYRLKREFTVSIFMDDGYWIADFPDLELAGWGDEEWQAKDDLRTQIIGLYEELRDTPHELSSHLKAQKAFLEDLIEERHG